MKKIIISFKLFFLIFSFGENLSGQNNNIVDKKIEIKITLVKQSFFKGEYVECEIELKNLSNSLIAIPFHGDVFNFIFKNKRGEILPYIGPMWYAELETLILEPNPEFTTDIILNEIFGNDTTTYSVREFMPDEYILSAVCGSLKSKDVNFIVKQNPVIENEIRAKIYGELLKSTSQQGVIIATQLIKEYRNSMYLPVVYTQLLICLDFQNMHKELKERSLEFIKKYSNSLSVKTGIHYYKKSLLNEKGVIKKSSLNNIDHANFIKEINKLKLFLPSNKRYLRIIDEVLVNE